ncbi:MAG: hypothetical protein HY820_25665 [Acidobacteria bacterium]|nr:hypothetical protein [Acidobacteriota bacterium]
MKKTLAAMTAVVMMMAGANLALAQGGKRPGPRQGQTQNPNPGTSKGKKLGPQDGSGPLHTPGTGGGTGAGQRKGRR